MSKFIPQKATGKFIKTLLRNPDWYAEERLSGMRTMAVLHGPHLLFSNPAIPRILIEEIVKEKAPPLELTNTRLVVLKANSAQAQQVGTVLDGVLKIDPVYVEKTRLVLFDCLQFAGENLTQFPLVRRRRYLRKAIEAWGNPFVSIVPNTTLSGESMTAMAERTSVVLKDLREPYFKPEAWVEVIKS